jgi:Holliday junction DNA helicase RuvA
MIVRIRGELAEIGSDHLVVFAGGVGYQLWVPRSVLAEAPEIGATVDLHVRQIIRENDIVLFGFATLDERRDFDALLTVSGLGPKTALALLSALGQERLRVAVAQRDANLLCTAPGVGKKLAQRICAELSESFQALPLATGDEGGGMDQVVAALMSLGHRRLEAERAAAAARMEVGDAPIEALVRVALQYASRS